MPAGSRRPGRRPSKHRTQRSLGIVAAARSSTWTPSLPAFLNISTRLWPSGQTARRFDTPPPRRLLATRAFLDEPGALTRAPLALPNSPRQPYSSLRARPANSRPAAASALLQRIIVAVCLMKSAACRMHAVRNAMRRPSATLPSPHAAQPTEPSRGRDFQRLGGFATDTTPPTSPPAQRAAHAELRHIADNHCGKFNQTRTALISSTTSPRPGTDPRLPNVAFRPARARLTSPSSALL